MQGPEKRLRTKPWTYWNGKANLLSPGDIIRLPIDVRVHLLTRVDDLDQLFQLGRQEPLMKAFMKKYDIFGKWFRYQCGLEEEDVDNTISGLSQYFDVDDDGYIMIEWRDRNDDENYIELSCCNSGVELWCKQSYDFLSEFDTVEYDVARNINAYVFTEDEPMMRFLKIAIHIDQRYKHMVKQRASAPITFNHRSPFDILCLVRLSKWSEWQFQYELDLDSDPDYVPAENINIVKVLRHTGEPHGIYTLLVQGLRDGTIKVSEL